MRASAPEGDAVRSRSGTASLLLVIAALAAGCGSGESEPTLPADVDVIVDTAAETMGRVDSVRFTIQRGGAPIFIDPLGALEFVEADGRFEGPSSADAVVTVSVGDLRAQVGAVAIDGEIWLTNPLTGNWEPTPEGYAFDPAALFDPDVGFRPLLAELDDRQLVGVEKQGGDELYHVTGVAGNERLSTVTGGLVRGQDVTVDLWLSPVDGSLREASFSTLHEGETTDWRLTFSGYGADITVEVPDLQGG